MYTELASVRQTRYIPSRLASLCYTNKARRKQAIFGKRFCLHKRALSARTSAPKSRAPSSSAVAEVDRDPRRLGQRKIPAWTVLTQGVR